MLTSRVTIMRTHRKKICDIKAGNGIIMHDMKKSFRHEHQRNMLLSKQRQHDELTYTVHSMRQYWGSRNKEI